MSWIAEFRHEM